MYLEERLGVIENENKQLRDDINRLLQFGMDRFVTPYELAELMNCSRPTVYRLIKEGKIYACRKTGNPRIPMSQFYSGKPEELIQRKHSYIDKDNKAVNKPKEPTMEKLIFG